jgi:hypothetical protein
MIYTEVPEDEDFPRPEHMYLKIKKRNAENITKIKKMKGDDLVIITPCDVDGRI